MTTDTIGQEQERVWKEGTLEQQASYCVLKERWDNVTPPAVAFSGKVWMVQVYSADTGCSMWLGIEPDGYTHS